MTGRIAVATMLTTREQARFYRKCKRNNTTAYAFLRDKVLEYIGD